MSDNLIMQQKRNPMIIKNLCPGLMELGKIKIGTKGALRQSQGGSSWQPPQKLDHFLITTMERGKDGNFMVDLNLHKQFGEAPKSLPVRLIYDDISLNFATRYICYYGKTVFCSGDGEVAQRLQPDKKTYAERTCPCGRQDPKYNGDDGPAGKDAVGGSNGKGKCKINGILSTIIDGAACVGGVWKFRTTSYNSVVGILSSLALIQRITGGRLAGIPMTMTVTPKTVHDPIQGSQQTIYVVSLQYAGTMDSLREVGYQIAMTEAKHGISMQRIEENARLMLVHTPTAGLGDDLADDVVEEFYPGEVAGSAVPDLVEAQTQDRPVGAVPEKTEDAPPLAGISLEQPGAARKRERGKPSPGHAKRTKAEMEEDRLADEADAKAQAQQGGGEPSPENEAVDTTTGEVTGDEPLPNLDGPEDGFPAPPDKTVAAQTPAGGDCPDLW